jgi:anti-sigma regulatory factor (Ser/Thr protein kinase)
VTLELDREYPAITTALPTIRRDVTALALRCGADDERVSAIAIAVTEAASNVIVHAYPAAGEAGDLWVHADAHLDAFEVVVSDVGVGLDSSHPGLGLALIDRLTDRVELKVPLSGRGTEMHLHFEWSAAPAKPGSSRSR